MMRIGITGPESTGKSVLATQLAAHYQTCWVPEFAREYLKNKKSYTYEDILLIAKGQVQSENNLLKEADRLIFSDTELIVTRIWSQVKYAKVDPWIQDHIIRSKYDLYLLCNIDLEWEYDPLREHPDRREELFSLYESVLQEIGANYRIVSGKGTERLCNAISFVDECLRSAINPVI